LLYARFGLSALRSLRGFARAHFRAPEAKALLAGIAAHAMRPLGEPATASFAWVLASAGHAVGWPLTRGGSRSLTAALVERLRESGGELELGHRVRSLDELPRAKAYLLDVTPRQLLELEQHALPPAYRKRLRRFRYGPGVFKLDWALSAPIPWRNAACARAATVHLSGSMDDISAGEAKVSQGEVAESPFVLLVQPTLFDPTRAPAGKHIAWAYCHVPHGSTLEVSARIEAHIERFAPGFRELVLARATRNPAELELYDPNYVGGDINGGSAEWSQLFFRPVVDVDPYATPARDIFLCSSSTPPGGGVHGMCGYFAARSALRHVFGLRPPPELDIDLAPAESAARGAEHRVGLAAGRR
jgi:phytoene dehydrogenase-like protein